MSHIRSLTLCTVRWTMLLILCPVAGRPWSAAGDEPYLADAVPLRGIVIDGRLEDWPERMVSHPIAEVGEASPHLQGEPPNGPADFTGRFHTGYDEATGDLYVAVVVEDDELGLPFQDQDGCVLGVDEHSTSGDAQRYFMGVGPSRDSHERNPGPQSFPPGTGSYDVKGAVVRLGTTTVYEWSIPLEATPGDTVGLAIAVADADGGARSSWISWRAGELAKVAVQTGGQFPTGELVPVAPLPRGRAAALTGTVRTLEGEAFHALVLGIMREGRLTASARTDANGAFHVDLLPGRYAIGVLPGFGAREGETLNVTLSGDAQVELVATPLSIPDELREVATRYAGLRSYRDTTLHIRTVWYGMAKQHGARPTTLAFERPNRIRVTDHEARGGDLVVVSDGKTLFAGLDRGMIFDRKQYVQRKAPGTLSRSDVHAVVPMGMPLDGLVLRLLLSEDPLSELMTGTTAMRMVGSDELDGTQTTVLEVDRFPRALHMSRIAGAENDPITMRVWVGQDDHLIRQVEFEQRVDAAAGLTESPAGQREEIVKRRLEKHVAIEIDGELPKGLFAFDVPAEAQLVERLTPMGQ